MTSNDEPRPPERRFGWPHAFAIVGVVTVLLAAGLGLYLFQVLRQAPERLAEGGREVAREVAEIARAFNSGTVTTSFISYATRVTGSNYLQFATLEQTELFERADRASTLWGAIDLPEVVVEARAPVQYTYYLDLNGTWSMELEEGLVQVTAPEIRFNKPAIDASAIEFRVRTDSLLRDEEEALVALQKGLSMMASRRAQENVSLVRELGRAKTAEFVSNWLLQSFGESSRRYHVEVLFADEAGRPTRLETPRLVPLDPASGGAGS